MKEYWSVIINPTTFCPMIALSGTGVRFNIDAYQDGSVDDNELMMVLLEELPDEKAADAYFAYKQFRRQHFTPT